MTDSFLPMMRALVAGALLLATATLMLVAVKTVRASAEPRLAPCATASALVPAVCRPASS
jgi:hypothetical protein